LRTVQSYDSAEYYYKEALELDPHYALAYAGLADCYTLGQQGMIAVEEIEVAKIYLTKALALDSNLCEAITTKGFIESHIEYEWQKGERTLARAIDINPNYSIARLYHGNIKIFTGSSINEGLEEVKKGLELDPLSPSVNWAVGSRYVGLELNESAVKQFRKTLAIDPGHLQAVIGMAYSLVRLQKYDEALDAINNAKALPAFYRDIFIALTYAERGETAKAKAQLEKLPAGLPRRGPPKPLVRTYIDLKDYDAAITMLEDQYKERSLNNLGLKIDPSFDPLRNLPRFKALIRKMNFE
jgi:tetratricopeptide (TPR) repeat protein